MDAGLSFTGWWGEMNVPNRGADNPYSQRIREYAVIRFGMIFAILLFASTANAQAIPRAILYGGTAFDLRTTWTGMQHGAREANPLMGQSKPRQAAVAAGSAMAVDWLALVLERDGHGRQATWLRVAVGVGHVVCAVFNMRNHQRGD